MKNIKKFAATLGLLGYIIMSVSSATADPGILVHDNSTPSNTTVIERLMNNVRNVVIGQLTGITVQTEDGILVHDREGILVHD